MTAHNGPASDLPQSKPLSTPTAATNGAARNGSSAITTIKKLSPHGQVKLALTRLAMVLATLFTLRYFYWRLFHTFNPAAKIFFGVFLAAEVLSFVESALFYFIGWKPSHYARPGPLPERTVDVFICTYNEPASLLRETVMCAVNMRYPHRTYILDDGARPEVRQLAEEFSCDYLARKDRTHAKAGNLNNALVQTTGEFVVTLDADHIPSPDLIDEMLGFFGDPSVAIVQATQDFYNLDSFQHRVNWKGASGWQQQELFFSVIQPGKDRYNATFYCGSPAIVRRKALEEIGGIPTGSITEDMHTSLRLQKRGWRVLYYNHTVARGLAPKTFTGFATQWRRWGQGAMQVLRAEKPFTSKGLDFKQKLAYFSSFYFYWMSFVKLCFIVTPVVSLLFSTFPLFTDPVSYASYFLPYFCLNVACSIVLQGSVRNFFFSEEFNLLKMHVLMPSVRGLFRHDRRFVVTPKTRAAAARAAEVLMPLVLVAALVAALAAGLVRISQVPPYGFIFWALAVNLFWSVVFLFALGAGVWRSLVRKEMRASYRFNTHLEIPLQVAYKEPSGKTITREEFARNLNRTGVSVTLDKAIAPGTSVDVGLVLPERRVHAAGQVIRNHHYKVKGLDRISSGIRFDQITPADQDEISRYLFEEIAPREGELLTLTHASQMEEEYETV
jgi:cellulose synthase (UDP-forming)